MQNSVIWRYRCYHSDGTYFSGMASYSSPALRLVKPVASFAFLSEKNRLVFQRSCFGLLPVDDA